MFLALLSMILLDGVQQAACDVHGLGKASAHGSMASGSMDASHGMTHQHGAPAHDSSAPDCDCTCIGTCTTVAPLAATPSAVTVRVALVAPQPQRALDREPDSSPPREPDKLLPFANGPPASALT
jgi:hypothetical protein